MPNRVLMLEDTDGDSVFDRSTVFADKTTFPQGAARLESLDAFRGFAQGNS